jgi:hypothetical protein
MSIINIYPYKKKKRKEEANRTKEKSKNYRQENARPAQEQV